MLAAVGYGASMPRVARILIPGVPHHITQRGNNRQDVFFVDDESRAYLGLLKELSLVECVLTHHLDYSPTRSATTMSTPGATNAIPVPDWLKLA